MARYDLFLNQQGLLCLLKQSQPYSRHPEAQQPMSGRKQYEQLDPDKIVETIDTLSRRIRERFPEAGLNNVCGKLLDVARLAKQTSAQFDRPIFAVRLLSGLMVALLLLLLIGAVLAVIDQDDWQLSTKELIQVIDAGMNELIAIGITLFFFISLEARIKRRRTLHAIHELRVISHIIDMHQLTKDPERLKAKGSDTPSSPRRIMTPFLLNRYLDYCSEMLSLIGKIAALYVQGFADEKAISAANEVENLTTGLSRKIWQKIMILNSTSENHRPLGN